MQFHLSASITDFPLQTPIEIFFKKFKEIGVDSIELVIGAKTLSIPHMFALSQKYELPIVSFHQSPWSGFGLSSDEYFIAQAKEHGVTTFTFHPLTFASFDSPRMLAYFKKLSKIQNKYGIMICLENMNEEFFYKQLHMFPEDSMNNHLKKMYDIASTYGFSLTYDVSHTRFAKPQEEVRFRKIFPKIRNIHLSSFHNGQEHLPLDTGDFDVKGFFAFLEKEKYDGLLTFEINYSLRKRIFTPYDFSEIARSVSVIRSLSDK